MPGYDVRTLETLRLELNLLELGLYRNPTPGRPLFVFQDSPTCPRYGADSCPNCVLMQFVPSDRRGEPVPCHHIQLDDAGETVDSLYRTGTQEELEEALRNWLTATITRLEEKQIQAGSITSFEMSPRKSAA
jgi:hypothetical protein